MNLFSMNFIIRFVRAVIFVNVAFLHSVSGQSFPLSENAWSNPDFQKRFLGSYGVRTEVEPPAMTRDEGRFFNDTILPLARDNQFPEAIRQLAVHTNADVNANFDFTLATLHLQTGNLTEAIRHYENAIKKFPNFLRAYKNLGFALTQSGEYQKATIMLAKAIELGEANGDTYGLLAFSYFNMGNYSASLDAYRMATTLNPSNRDWLVGKTRALQENRRFEEVIAACDELLSQNPSDVRFWITRANAFVGLQEFDQAILNLEWVRRLGGATAGSLRLLGDLYINEGLPQLAVLAYKDAMDIRMPAGNALRIAKVFIDRRNYNEADEFLNQIEALFAGEFDEDEALLLLNYKAATAFARGETDEGIAALQSILQVNPLDNEALFQLAKYHVREDNREEAIYYFERAQNTGTDSQRFDVFIEHAVFQVRLKEFGKAAELLRAALRIRFERRIQQYLEAVESAHSRS